VEILKGLIEPNDKRILLLVVDGLGGSPSETGKTEMENARIPNLDELAKVSSLGLTDPVGSGITPGSGPAHLALFGYDPIEHQVGRGILEALGSGLRVAESDLCIRANFCTFDRKTGKVVDRRAGRIPTTRNQELVARITERVKRIEDAEVIVRSEYRTSEHSSGHWLRLDCRGDVYCWRRGPIAEETQRSSRN
jgi:2,3-bisphosphoglycerate-independent phosphoglycerate mutase